jgi:hypothetical protein
MTTVAAPTARAVPQPPPALAALGDPWPALFLPDAKTARSTATFWLRANALA